MGRPGSGGTPGQKLVHCSDGNQDFSPDLQTPNLSGTQEAVDTVTANAQKRNQFFRLQGQTLTSLKGLSGPWTYLNRVV